MRRRIWELCKGKSVAKSIMGKRKGEVLLEANQPMREDVFAGIPLKKLAGVFLAKEVNEGVKSLLETYDLQLDFIKDVYENKRGKVTEGDDLPPGVIKMAKVYVAVKRKLNLAGLPVAGLCYKIMNKNRTIARLPNLIEFTKLPKGKNPTATT